MLLKPLLATPRMRAADGNDQAALRRTRLEHRVWKVQPFSRRAGRKHLRSHGFQMQQRTLGRSLCSRAASSLSGWDWIESAVWTESTCKQQLVRG